MVTLPRDEPIMCPAPLCLAEADWHVGPQATGGPLPDPHSSPHFDVCIIHVGWAANHYGGPALARRMDY